MKLIKLAIDNQAVSLPDNFVIRMVFKMPLPYLDNIPAALTYWFNLPSNEVNDPIFKHANYIYSTSKLRTYDCIIDVANLQMKGKLYLKNANIKQYKAFIVFNDLIENLSSKKLSSTVNHSYHMGNNTSEIVNEMKRMQNLSWPDVPYGFPTIVNTEFFWGGGMMTPLAAL